jgi:ankyrin repeat protein
MYSEIEANFMRAVWELNAEKAQKLIANGININEQINGNSTFLLDVVEQEDLEAVKFLVSLGANINLADKNGWTPLHHAVDVSIDGTIQSGKQQGSEPTEIIEYLLQNGADLSATDFSGKTPLDIARDYQSYKIISLLKHWNNDANQF